MDRRVKFNFEIYFTNGGNLKGEDFRLDILGDNISDKELTDYIVSDLRLLMVGETKILNKEILVEPHKRKPINVTNSKDLFIDLTHPIEHLPQIHKGQPEPNVSDYLDIENSKQLLGNGSDLQIEKFTNTETYLECQYQGFKNEKNSTEIGLAYITDIESIVIRAPFSETLEITDQYLKNFEIRNRAVLIHTGWDINWNSENYYENHPYLTESAAQYLKDCDVKLVGIDSYNIDNTTIQARPVHAMLLGAGILIVENLCNLNLLPKDDFTFSAIPPKLIGLETIPVRAIAKLNKKS